MAKHYQDSMRNVHVRSKGLIFVALALTGFGAFSYWGLSTQNTDLLSKIDQLEDNLKMGSSRQLELEEKLQAMAKKHSDQLTANAKLQSELLQKENIISAQGEEGSQWRDKVRAAESEVAKFKTVMDDKEKEISDLKERVKSILSQITAKDSELNELKELVKSLQAKVGPIASNLISTSTQNQTSTQTPPGASDSRNVIAKPDNNNNADEAKADDAARSDNEKSPIQPEEELELVDPKNNVIDQPEQADNDEGKFKEIREEMEMNDEKNNANEIIKEPSLLNSQQDDNAMDDEPNNNNNGRNNDENNQPEDQEIENDNEDNRLE